jgi:GAF domain-containing protein
MSSTSARQAVDAVAQFLVAEVSLGDTLQRIAELACDAVGPATSVGLTLLDDDDRPATRVSTDDVASRVDSGQYEDSAGPCLDAYRENRVVLVEDISANAERWPSFSARADEEGVRSSLSLPLAAGGDRMGVMNLYATGAVFTAEDMTDAQLFATQAAVVLANARAYWTAFDLSAGLQTALASRAVIDQAKGKLMASQNCSADEAFQLLVKVSQRENTRLRDVAQRIVDGRLPEEQPAHE